MTLRLVALMSVVLLLSLVAVGLLVHHFQQQFMEEVQTTASDVGQAALRTIELTGGKAVDADTAIVRRSPAGGEHSPPAAAPGEAAGVVERAAPESEPPRAGGIRHIITTTAEGDLLTVREHLIYPAGEFPDVLPGEALEEEFEACLQARFGGPSSGPRRIYFNVEAVRAEANPNGRGFILRIPKLTQEEEEEGTSGGPEPDATAVWHSAEAAPEAVVEDVYLSRRDEIRLPIRGNYRELFSRLRNRSLFLFLGVFLVGIALSTGLASRFTRPVRKLDAALHRLSEGDLDVEVDARGRGEIGRLGRAFNDMARKLRENREREREMIRREKLSALGRLAAGVAHDVRNPLHSIGLTLQHLSDAARPESEQRQAEFEDAVGTIRGEIRRLDRIVGNFLEFARSERRDRRPVDLGQLVRDTVGLVEKEAERRGVRIDVTGPSGPATVSADAEAIRSTLLNLILNAFEAMPDGGLLSLALRQEDGEVVLEVADDGEGIPEDEREHVFEFAYTTREGGNGLGLAMVHHCVVEEHGGRVSLESSPGRGTRVRLVLPARDGAEA